MHHQKIARSDTMTMNTDILMDIGYQKFRDLIGSFYHLTGNVILALDLKIS
jgi:hypothetical protein